MLRELNEDPCNYDFVLKVCHKALLEYSSTYFVNSLVCVHVCLCVRVYEQEWIVLHDLNY